MESPLSQGSLSEEDQDANHSKHSRPKNVSVLSPLSSLLFLSAVFHEKLNTMTFLKRALSDNARTRKMPFSPLWREGVRQRAIRGMAAFLASWRTHGSGPTVVTQRNLLGGSQIIYGRRAQRQKIGWVTFGQGEFLWPFCYRAIYLLQQWA